MDVLMMQVIFASGYSQSSELRVCGYGYSVIDGLGAPHHHHFISTPSPPHLNHLSN
jgi:hypothetical protein